MITLAKPRSMAAKQRTKAYQSHFSFYRPGQGVSWFNESERRHVFHLAGKRFSIDDTDWTGDRKNQLVLIGRDIDHSTLREQLQACVAD